MKELLEREELDFIFDLYRPSKKPKSENVKPKNANYKELRKPDIPKNEGVSHYLI
ncbi:MULTISPECIES: hypothetical protein [Pseudoalteromonas]|uniref:hypothetical protein n=1 Tax=Pseudoalteromonas TaxID=53246 RepID=UPI00020A03F2|nr:MULTISPECIES: hypothetical protein [Pseudoalteromonas]EGI72167.1 hypothetical protein PH505_bv00120 [Pseudoalteromonas distincta]MDQ2045600.1 hypothetical protein [Pseudoalteromonas sp. 20-92]GAA80492.1 hypothetical protein P20495_3007 [Pseudoalteromonas sp. BSi20495]